MPVAALPEYIGSDFREASPGMRFGLYLSIWTSRKDQENEVHRRCTNRSREGGEVADLLKRLGMEGTINKLTEQKSKALEPLWKKSKTATEKAWRQTCEFSTDDRERMAALLSRQQGIVNAAAKADKLMVVDARSTSPFTTGLGIEHPLENGFAFLNPYGLPYLPGSSVKGILRQAARELAGLGKEPWQVKSDWSQEAINALFGFEDSNNPRRGALSFWDVIPQLATGAHLVIDVMTSHQSHYYQNSETPHESGKPVPINFLTVPQDAGFIFHVRCSEPFLARIAPELAEGEKWRNLLQQAFEHAFDWLGFGAKTAVGYGAMEIDVDRQAARQQEQELKEATADLPADAAEIFKMQQSGRWQGDNSQFLRDINKFLDNQETPSQQAIEMISKVLEERWEGVIRDPDAISYEKKKPKQKHGKGPRELAKRIRDISNR